MIQKTHLKKTQTPQRYLAYKVPQEVFQWLFKLLGLLYLQKHQQYRSHAIRISLLQLFKKQVTWQQCVYRQ